MESLLISWLKDQWWSIFCFTIKHQTSNYFLKIYSSLLEESTDSWRAESVPTAELVPHQQSTVLPSLSTSPLRFLSLLVTLPRILRSRELHQDISNLPSEEMKSLTLWSRPPSLVVVLSHTSTRLSSWRPPRPRSELSQQINICSEYIWTKWEGHNQYLRVQRYFDNWSTRAALINILFNINFKTVKAFSLVHIHSFLNTIDLMYNFLLEISLVKSLFFLHIFEF